jgi:hypothetical protein
LLAELLSAGIAADFELSGTSLARRQPSHDPIRPFVVQVLYNPPLFRALAVVRDFT